MNRQGETLDAIEERMQSANKAFWRDILVYRSGDVPWRIKCGRFVDHVYSVFSFGSENWSWTTHTMDNVKRRETEKMMRVVLIQKKERRNVGRVQYKMFVASRGMGMWSEAQCGRRLPEAGLQVDKFSMVACHTY